MNYIKHGSHAVMISSTMWYGQRSIGIGSKIARRLRELIRQGCEARDIKIVRANVKREHVHLLISCPPTIAPSKIMQYLKGRSSKMLQEEFKELRQRYWGQHLWASGYFCRTVGSVTEEDIKKYVEEQGKHRDNDAFKIEDEE